jgi:predicted Co/Zn/Cd cation transporter (cation efflux family)
MDIDKIENKALRLGIFISFIMALAGWITYYFTDSEAMLLDGNFSMISVVASIIALIISKRKHEKTKTFPFGSYVFESLFVFVKGLLILGVIIVAGVQNSIKIIDFINGVNIEPVKIDFILYYVALITILCFSLFLYFRSMNKRVDFKSPILKIETQSTLVDGFLTLGIGIIFIVILLIPENSPLAFMNSIGDAIIVLVICLLFINMPLKILRASFIELGGGVLQDNPSKQLIENAIEESLSPSFIKQSSYISKLGSSYFIAVFITSKSDVIHLDDIETFRKDVLNLLIPKFQNVKIEVIARGKNSTV